jgi:hypothetical protein
MCSVCEAYFRDFQESYDELRDKFILNPHRELHVNVSDEVVIKLKFDANRIKEVMGFKPLTFNGHASLPVLVDRKVKLLLAYDSTKDKWFLPCGRSHFPWCNSHRGRKA